MLDNEIKGALPDPSSRDENQNLESLRQDLDAALRHLHFMSMQSKHDLVDLISRLYALMEEMVARKQLDLRSFEERRLRLKEREEARLLERTFVHINETPDKYALTNLPQIDCQALMPICQARCCQLVFPLSLQDLDERVVQWDYAAPYLIRRNSEGSCVHWDPASGLCAVYEQRPAVCRAYDCRTDRRIWADFYRRLLATEAPANEGGAQTATQDVAAS
jgi:Fe-S-cluster containining protein